MGIKGDFKGANPASNVNDTAAKKDLTVETAPKRDYKDDVIEDLNCDLKKLQKSLTCVICLEMLFEPYALQCGHVFCYTCMLDWLDQAHKMTCPECRSVVKVQPAPAYLIKDMIEVFVLRAELTSPNGNGLELRKQQQAAIQAVERDKADEGKKVKGGLFRGLFKAKKKDPRVLQDLADGVLRCPRCNWEIEDGYRNRICGNCGDRFRRLSRYGDFSDDDDDDDEDEDDDDEDDSGSETDTDHGRVHPLFESSDENELEEDGWDADDAIRMFARNHLRGRFDDDEDEEDEDEDEHDDDDEDEEDHRIRMRDSSDSTTGGRDEPIILEDGSDTDEATRNVQRPPRVVPQAGRRARHRATNHTETSEDEGSLADFIEHDTPEVRRGRPVPGRNRAGTRNIFNNSPVVISSSPAIIAPTRRNARRTVIDDEEEDNQSSVSEASSIHPRRDYSQRRGPIALPSDNDDDDDLETLGHNMGYTPLDYTASENEDESFVSPSSGGGNHTNVSSHNTGSSSVFSVPEEDEEDDEDDESRAFGDDDESEDQDGDARMGENEQRRRIPSSQRAVRNRTRGSRPHSESDSDAPTTRRRRIQAAGSMSNYRPGETSSSRNWSSRRQREIDPAFLNMFQQHSQAITEGRLESLGSMNPSVSPARSATPVQRNYTGGSSSRATRSTRESIRESRESTRERTPVQAMGQGSPPPPFSPMFQGINSSLASNSPVPNSPAPSNSQMQSPRLGAEARTGSEGGSSNQTSLQSSRPVPITIGASPQASRMRTRNSRQQLRGTTSRSGPRLGSTTITPNISQAAQPQGVTSTAAAHGRHQGARPILTAAASRGRRGIPLTTEDIRARGEAIRRQRQEAESAIGLGRRSSRRNLSSSTTNGNGSSAPVPLVTVARTGSNTLQGNGRRVGAVIGGIPGQGAGGGPMLIIDNGDE